MRPTHCSASTQARCSVAEAESELDETLEPRRTGRKSRVLSGPNRLEIAAHTRDGLELVLHRTVYFRIGAVPLDLTAMRRRTLETELALRARAGPSRARRFEIAVER